MEDESSLIDEEFIAQLRGLGVKTSREVRSIGHMLGAWKRGEFELNPPYQRNYVWSEQVACRLIESVMMNLTIPEIYVRRTLVNYEEHDDMVDGKQRCTTLLNFCMNNRPAFWKSGVGFRLAGCKRMPCLNGLCYSDFTKKMLTQFHGYMLGVVAVKGADDEAVGEFLQHLNENTAKRTDREIRTAVRQGPFNQLVKELAMRPEFQEFISESVDLRMQSKQVLVRFLAFCRNGAAGYDTARMNLNANLDAEDRGEFCQRDRYAETAGHLVKRALVNAVALSSAVFGRPGAKARISNTLFEVVMCGFANRDQASVLRHAAEIRDTMISDPFSAGYCMRGWENTLNRILGKALIPVPEKEVSVAEGAQEAAPARSTWRFGEE